MAQERATITFTLEDEFSSKMEEIVGKLEDFKRRLDETSKAGSEGFRRVSEHVKQVGDHSAGANASLRSMSTYMKDAFGEFNRTIAGSVQGLTQFESRITTLGPVIKGLGEGFGRVGRIIGGVGGAAAAAGGSLYLLGRYLAQSYEQATLLERRLGSTGAAIENMKRLAARGGYGEEQAIATLDKILQHAYETRRGVEASLDKALRYGISGVGPAIADEAERILKQVRDKQITPEEGYEFILKNIYGVQTSEEVKRVIAKALGLTFEQMEADFENMGKRIKAINWSEDLKAALKRMSDTIHKGMEEISNEWTKSWNAMGPEAVDKMNESIAKMQEAVKNAMPVITKEIAKIIHDLATIPDGINEIITAWNNLKNTFNVDIWPRLPEWMTNPPPLLRKILGIDEGTSAAEAKARKEGRSTTEGSIARRIADMFEANRDPTKEWTRDIIPSRGGGDTPYVPAHRADEMTDEDRRWIREQEEKRRQGQGTPQRFMGGGGDRDFRDVLGDIGARINPKNWDAAVASWPLSKNVEDRRGEGAGGQGGQPIVLTRMAEAQDEMRDHLANVRDVMEWLRDEGLGLGIPVRIVDPSKTTQGGTAPGSGATPGAGPAPTQGPPSAGQLNVPGQQGGQPQAGGGAVNDKILDAIQKQEGWFPGSISYSQNNPGNIKYGPFAKAHGATGAGRGGHAIFPDYATGRAALAALISGKYAGQSLAQISQHYAEGPQGGMHWAQGVAKYAGVTPDYVPSAGTGGAPQQGQPSAMPGTQAAGGPQGGGAQTGQGENRAPPSNILEAAKRVAALGGGPAVFSFMASQGYPKAGNWCGEFAAAVVRSAGGTPPRNPEVASNWRNFGQQVATPQPGDIAVRIGRSRGGGYVPTGQTGSHVTIVGGVQGGSFTGIGGNQGRIMSQYATGAYQFFRPGGAGAGGQPIAGIAGGGVQAPMLGGGAGAGGGGGLPSLLGGGGGGFGGGGGGVTGQATITINVTVPPGAQVQSSAQGSGILANPTVTTSRAGQGTAAGQNATPRPNYYGNEY